MCSQVEQKLSRVFAYARNQNDERVRQKYIGIVQQLAIQLSLIAESLSGGEFTDKRRAKKRWNRFSGEQPDIARRAPVDAPAGQTPK